MAKFRFKGEEGSQAPCTVYGIEFPVGEWVEGPDSLATNQMFDAKPERAAKAAEEPKAAE